MYIALYISLFLSFLCFGSFIDHWLLQTWSKMWVTPTCKASSMKQPMAWYPRSSTPKRPWKPVLWTVLRPSKSFAPTFPLPLKGVKHARNCDRDSPSWSSGHMVPHQCLWMGVQVTPYATHLIPLCEQLFMVLWHYTWMIF